MLQNIPMSTQVYDGVKVNRTLLTTETILSSLSWKERRATMLVQIAHTVSVTRTLTQETIDPLTGLSLGQTTRTLTEEVPYEAGFARGTGGRRTFLVPVLPTRMLDAATGREATLDTPPERVIDAFAYFRGLLLATEEGGGGLALESLIMLIFARHVAEDVFETDFYELAG